MTQQLPELLTFEEQYFERIWGGSRLKNSLHRNVPEGRVIGEAWLVSDHAECQSVVAEGPWKGRTLHEVMTEFPEYLLGSGVRPTPFGQFPLLLKLIDSGDVLSVQVHPDDETASLLGEPDVGKTEMWHVLEADPGAELVCGLKPGITREVFERAVADGTVDGCLEHRPAPAGTSVFVPAGTVHAIGGGILLAEIQQNSNITYRVYDWNRVDFEGEPRALHLEKALECIDFDTSQDTPSHPFVIRRDGAEVSVISGCSYFIAKLVNLFGQWNCEKGLRSFHLVLAAEGDLDIRAGVSQISLKHGQVALVAGGTDNYTILGRGKALVYYVPSLVWNVAGRSVILGHDGMAMDTDEFRTKPIQPKIISETTAQELNIPVVHLKDITISDDIIRTINSDIAALYRILPLTLKQGVLTIGTDMAPTDAIADDMRQLLALPVNVVFVPTEELVEAIQKFYCVEPMAWN